MCESPIYGIEGHRFRGGVTNVTSILTSHLYNGVIMAEDKKEEEKFDFTSDGKALGCVSLARARLRGGGDFGIDGHVFYISNYFSPVCGSSRFGSHNW